MLCNCNACSNILAASPIWGYVTVKVFKHFDLFYVLKIQGESECIVTTITLVFLVWSSTPSLASFPSKRLKRFSLRSSIKTVLSGSLILLISWRPVLSPSLSPMSLRTYLLYMFKTPGERTHTCLISFFFSSPVRQESPNAQCCLLIPIKVSYCHGVLGIYI